MHDPQLNFEIVLIMTESVMFWETVGPLFVAR